MSRSELNFAQLETIARTYLFLAQPPLILSSFLCPIASTHLLAPFDIHYPKSRVHYLSIVTIEIHSQHARGHICEFFGTSASRLTDSLLLRFTSVKLVRQSFLSLDGNKAYIPIGVQIGNACWELYTIEHGLSVS